MPILGGVVWVLLSDVLTECTGSRRPKAMIRVPIARGVAWALFQVIHQRGRPAGDGRRRHGRADVGRRGMSPFRENTKSVRQ